MFNNISGVIFLFFILNSYSSYAASNDVEERQLTVASTLLTLNKLSTSSPDSAKQLMQELINVSSFNYAEQYLLYLIKAKLQQHEQHHKEAIILIEQAKVLSEHISDEQLNSPVFSDAYLVLSQNYAAIKDYKNAFENKKIFVDKLVEAAQRPDTHRYSVSRGIPRLRKAICDWYQRKLDVELDPDSETIVTIGSKEGLAHLALATVGPGDAVLVPNPAYPIHPYGFVIAGADIRHVPLTPDVDFFAELEKSVKDSWPKPKMLVLNFPSNPTAQCVELEFYERVIAIAREYSIWVVQDLAYADLCYDGYVAPSILQVEGAREVAVEFFSMSKSYNMPGWRTGFMCGSPVLIGALAKLKSYLDYGMFTPIQVAEMCGFSSQSAMTSLFTQMLGITPIKFQKQWR